MVARVKSRITWMVVGALWPGIALGQGRGFTDLNRRLTGPSMRTVGGSLRDYSYGLGGLQRSLPGGSSGLLRSSVSGPSSYGARRVSSVSTLGGALKLPSLSTGYSYESPTLNLRVPGADPRPRMSVPGPSLPGVKVPQAILATSDVGIDMGVTLQPYLAAMGYKSALEQTQDKPITSFVPSEPSIYQKHMAEGDSAFRAERYLGAAGSFEVAVRMADHASEAHLSLAHAYFALGRYYSAAHNVQQAIKYFGNLPLARLTIRGFYGQAERFDEHMKTLTERCKRDGGDPSLWLLVAYVRYFDGDSDQAAAALRKAEALGRRGAGQNEGIAEAVKAFWDGMRVAGKATGHLGPATTTAPATQKVSPAPPGKSRKPEIPPTPNP